MNVFASPSASRATFGIAHVGSLLKTTARFRGFSKSYFNATSKAITHNPFPKKHTMNTPKTQETTPKVMTIRPDGMSAEIEIDTGIPLSTGRTWRAYAKVRCQDVYTATLVARQLNKRLGDWIERVRRNAYLRGYRDARAQRPALKHFPRHL